MNISKAVRSAMVALIGAATFVGTAQAADAAKPDPLTTDLATLWTTVLQTPSAQNSFGSGGTAFACWDLGGHVVAPLGPAGVPSCTVRPGTRIFEAGSTVECSTFEGTAEAELATCARQSDVPVAPQVTLDGHSVPVSEVQTPVLSITLPADNVFGLPAGSQGKSVAHGWVTLLNPLSANKTHTIKITGSVTGTPVETTIIVNPH
jgi:hypothetical protein